MPNIDASRIVAFAPQTSTGIMKPNYETSGKESNLLQNMLLKSASPSNEIPVVVKDGAPIAKFVITEQNTRQVFATGTKLDDNKNVTEVRLARYDPDGVRHDIDWCDAAYITCGTLADAKIPVSGKEPVQTEPVVPTTPANDTANSPLQSFIFYDPYADDDKDHTKDKTTLERAVGTQRDVARFMGLCGSGKVTKAQQKKIDKRVHLVPFSDFDGSILEEFPELKPMAKAGINTDLENFIQFWNNHVATSKVHIVIFENHAGADGISMNNRNGKPSIKKEEIERLHMPPIDYILLIGCNLGNVSYSDNIAQIFCACTGTGNPQWVKKNALQYIVGTEDQTVTYPTAIVAADGKTSSVTRWSGKYIMGMNNCTGKYDKSGKRIEGQGFCVFSKQFKDPVEIPGTAATPGTATDPEKATDPGKTTAPAKEEIEWTEHSISVEKILQEVKRIVRE